MITSAWVYFCNSYLRYLHYEIGKPDANGEIVTSINNANETIEIQFTNKRQIKIPPYNYLYADFVIEISKEDLEDNDDDD